MLKYFTFSILIFFVFFKTSFSQNEESIHQEQSEFYSNFDFRNEADWNVLNNVNLLKKPKLKRNLSGELTKEVFGWNPYWMGTSYYNFDYSLLSEVSYFSYEVDFLTGLPKDIHYWKTTNLVDSCHNNGVKVSLTATLFSEHQTFFTNPTAVNNFIDTIIKLVQFRNADGINIDFEAVSSSQKDNLTNFVIKLSDSLHAKIPNSRLSIAIPAVDWSSTFNVAAMNDYIDLFLIMGYEYYWSGSSQAGPGSPKNGGDIWGSYNTTKSINDYLDKGILLEKLCLAIPYYGRQWSTVSNAIPSNTTSKGTAVIYSSYMNSYSQSNTHWDLNSSTPVNIYANSGSGYNQCWQNDARSLAYKYDYIKLKNIGGIGIWALGYDGSYSELWDVLSEKFTPSGNNNCEDYFSDNGGPLGKYYNNENWIYTIAPKNPAVLKMVFSDFELEQDYDFLSIYDGLDTLSPLIGRYTGNSGPQDTLISTTGAFTFHFISDGATVKEGWNARWTCDNFSIITKIIDIKSDINISPNPFNDYITLNLGTQNTKKVQINIYNVLGQNVFSQEFSNPTKILNIQTSNLQSNSIYFMNIIIGDAQLTKLIIKK